VPRCRAGNTGIVQIAVPIFAYLVLPRFVRLKRHTQSASSSVAMGVENRHCSSAASSARAMRTGLPCWRSRAVFGQFNASVPVGHDDFLHGCHGSVWMPFRHKIIDMVSFRYTSGESSAARLRRLMACSA